MADEEVTRDAGGRIVKGSKSLNPSGRPGTGSQKWLREKMRQITPAAIAELAKIITDPKAKPTDKLNAIKICIAYGFGMPSAVEPDSGDLDTLRIQAESVINKMKGMEEANVIDVQIEKGDLASSE